MGGETFDVLLQHITTGAKLLRTWSANELEKVTGWLSRMNARGHDIFIRPSGEHGLVLVPDLKKEAVDKMRHSTLAPAVVLETGPDAYQAWVKLSDQAVSPRVRSMAAHDLAKQHQGDRVPAGPNDYGRLAGFARHQPGHAREGSQPIVLIQNCLGRVAAEGLAYANRIAQFLDNQDIVQEKHKRLKAITSFQSTQVQSDPVYEYQRQAQQLIKQHGKDIDPTRMDQLIATTMLQSGSFTKEGMERALQFASPNVHSIKANAMDAYARQTVDKVMRAMPIPAVQRYQEPEQERDRGLSR